MAQLPRSPLWHSPGFKRLRRGEAVNSPTPEANMATAHQENKETSGLCHGLAGAWDTINNSPLREKTVAAGKRRLMESKIGPNKRAKTTGDNELLWTMQGRYTQDSSETPRKRLFTELDDEVSPETSPDSVLGDSFIRVGMKRRKLERIRFALRKDEERKHLGEIDWTPQMSSRDCPSSVEYWGDIGTSPRRNNRELMDPETPCPGGSNEEDIAHSRFLQWRVDGRVPKYILAQSFGIRYCIFNTGNHTERDVWGILKRRLEKNTLNGILRVKRINQPNGKVRIDMWVTNNVAAGIAANLRLDVRARAKTFCEIISSGKGAWINNHDYRETRRWRISEWKDWRDDPKRIEIATMGYTGRVSETVIGGVRCLIDKALEDEIAEPLKHGLATFNINGFHAKHEHLAVMMEKLSISVMAIQETLVSSSNSPLLIAGYKSFIRQKKVGFRGQAVLVRKDLKAYEVDTKSDYIIYVKVVGLPGKSGPWHIMGVYLPSGSNHEKRRKVITKQILQLHGDIMKAEKNPAVVILGDWNTESAELASWLKSHLTGLQILQPKGSEKTRYKTKGRWTAIDHMVVSEKGKALLAKPCVRREWEVSDHWPLAARTRSDVKGTIDESGPSFRFDRELIKGHGINFVTHNRWDMLEVEEIENNKELDRAFDRFTDTIDYLGKYETGLKKQIIGSKTLTPRGIKRAINKKVAAKKRVLKEAKENGMPSNEALQSLAECTEDVQQKVNQHREEIKNEEVKRVCGFVRNNEAKRLHDYIRKECNQTKASVEVTPVKDRDNRLQTSIEGICTVVEEHYRELATDPTHRSKDKNHWEQFVLNEREEIMGLNDEPTFPDVLMAIRHMRRGTAVGIDEVPIELLKEILKAECNQEAQRGRPPLDHVYVTLAEDQLPDMPSSKMGEQLWRIIKGIWKCQQFPEKGNLVEIVSLFKGGEPEKMSNYRGISLISTVMKVVLTIIQQRLLTATEGARDDFVKEQAGYRPGEEAVAQFMAVYEMIRRRCIDNKRTYGVFIDFKKAFDMVPHEALLKKCHAFGIRGNVLNLIRNVYSHSEMRVKVGNMKSNVFGMEKGTRQGCPLSPILFIIYINDILDKVDTGILVPGLTERCKGTLFCDDVLGLCESKEGAKTFLNHIKAWADDWGMFLGIDKCKVMLFGATETELSDFDKEEFRVGKDQIGVTRSYRYLGIVMTTACGMKTASETGSNERHHIETMVEKGKRALHAMRPLLRKRHIPITVKVETVKSKLIPILTFGAEWVGLNKEIATKSQQVVDSALRMILGGSKKTKNYFNSINMSIELGVQRISTILARQRVRLYLKAPALKTWLGILANNPPSYGNNSRKRTWLTQTEHQMKKDLTEAQTFGDNPEEWRHWITEMNNVEAEVRSSKRGNASRREIEDYGKMITEIEMRHGLERKELIKEKVNSYEQVLDEKIALRTEAEKKVTFTEWYDKYAFGATRGYIKQSSWNPKLVEGIRWLARMRIRATLEINRIRHARSCQHLEKNKCPACGEEFEYEWAHLLLHCKKDSVVEARKRMLGSQIERLRLSGNTEKPSCLNLSDEVMKTDEVVAIYLLGGSLSGVDVDVADLRDLTVYKNGFGHIPKEYGHEFAHGFIGVACFLQAVMPGHLAIVLGKENCDPKRPNYSSTEEALTLDEESGGVPHLPNGAH